MFNYKRPVFGFYERIFFANVQQQLRTHLPDASGSNTATALILSGRQISRLAI